MADIKISGGLKVKTFQAAFLKNFPFLCPTLLQSKSLDVSGPRLSNEHTISKCATLTNGEWKPVKVAEFSLSGNMLVGTFEKRFLETFGVRCEVVFRKSGKHFKTGADLDKMTLAAANKKVSEDGAEPINLSDIAAYA
jgi:hypothetical protein